MGQGDAGIGRNGDGRSDPRNHFKGNPRLNQFFGLFTPPAEDERIAPLESDHVFSGPSPVNNQLVDFALREGIIPALFPT